MTNNNQRYLLVHKATFVCMAAVSLLILAFRANLSDRTIFVGLKLSVCLAVVLIAHTFCHEAEGWAFFFRDRHPRLFLILLRYTVAERNDDRAKQETTQREFSLDLARSD